MKSLSKAQMKAHATIADDLATVVSAVSDRVSEYNGAVEEAYRVFEAACQTAWNEHLDGVQEDLNASVEQAQTLVTEVTGNMECYYDDRSEKWRESDKGEQYQEWISVWENTDLEVGELAPAELYPPEPLDLPEIEPEEFTNLPATPDEV